MGAGCSRIRLANGHESVVAPNGSGRYVDHPDVRRMFELLESERPQDLRRWLRSYADTNRFGRSASFGASSSGIFHDSSSSSIPMNIGRVHSARFTQVDSFGGGTALDWRHHIFDAEHGVLKTSREILRKTQADAATNLQSNSSSSPKSAAAASFIPKVIVEAIHEERIKDSDTAKVILESPIHSTYDPIIFSLNAVVVFMDASGFTSLTENLAKQENGAEEIGRCLNSFFGPLIRIVYEFGGDILKFSGDALTILWPIAPDGKSMEDSDTFCSWSKSPASAAKKACTCCLEVQKQVAAFGKTPIDGLSLTLHIGMALGPLNILQVGGLMNRWEYCAAGPPLEEVAIAEPLARSGETVVSPSVIDALKKTLELSRFEFAKVHGSAPPEGYKLLVGVHEGASVHHLGVPGVEQALLDFFGGISGMFQRNGHGEAVIEVDGLKGNGGVTSTKIPSNPSMSSLSAYSMGSEYSFGEHTKIAAMPPMSAVKASLIERYVPRAVLRGLASGQLNAEMRRASIVFLSLHGTDPGRYKEDAKQTQLVVRLLQRSCYALEGSLNKFLIDDKGMVLLACFGLPPLNHFTDDPLRAVLAAARFCDSLREENVEGHAAIATGLCWCGVVGSELRREYTVLGDSVNLAARLMGRAKKNSVLVDRATMNACKSVLEFSSLGEIKVKGKADPQSVYEFVGTAANKLKGKQPNPSLMGWDGWPAKVQLDAALSVQLGQLSSTPTSAGRLRRNTPPPRGSVLSGGSEVGGAGGLIFVKGGPGSGKTEIAAHIRHWTQEKDLALLSGQNMNITSTFAVHLLCWQEVFKQLMQLAGADSFWIRRLEEAGLAPKELSSSATYLYGLMLLMLKEAGASEDLLSWAPLMNVVLTGLDFAPKVVQAMLERDEQHTRDRSRLGELCETLVEAFTTYSTLHRGTVVLIHIKRSTAFFQTPDEHSGHIARALSRLASTRRSRGRGKPFLLCIVSRQGILPDETILNAAAECQGLVHVQDLNRSRTAEYMQQFLFNPELDPNLVNYVFEVTGGNPFFIGELCQMLMKEGIIIGHAGRYDLAEEWSDALRLHNEIRFPENLVGVALAEFEKLNPSKQQLLKVAAVLCQEWDVDDLGVATTSSFCALDLAASIKGGGGDVSQSEAEKVQQLCVQLKQADIFVLSVADDEMSGTSEMDETGKVFYRFKSQLLRHVASTLVLKEQHRSILNIARTGTRRSQRRLSKTNFMSNNSRYEKSWKLASVSYDDAPLSPISNLSPFLPSPERPRDAPTVSESMLAVPKPLVRESSDPSPPSDFSLRSSDGGPAPTRSRITTEKVLPHAGEKVTGTSEFTRRRR